MQHVPDLPVSTPANGGTFLRVRFWVAAAVLAMACAPMTLQPVRAATVLKGASGSGSPKKAKAQHVIGDWVKWQKRAATAAEPPFGVSTLTGGRLLSAAALNPVPSAYLTPGSDEVPDTCASVSMAVALALSCTLVDTIHADSELQVEHCFGRDHGAGFIIIQLPPLEAPQQPLQRQRSQQQQQAMQLHVSGAFRMRVVGPEILLPDVHYCSHGIVLGTYRVFRPGDYHLEVLTLQMPFHHDTGGMLDQKTLYAAELFVTFKTAAEVLSRQGPRSSGDTGSSKMQRRDDGKEVGQSGGDSADGDGSDGNDDSEGSTGPLSASLPLCSFEESFRGRFVSDAPLKALSFLYPMCVFQESLKHPLHLISDMLPLCLGKVMDKAILTLQPSLLRWEPYGCQLTRHDTPTRSAACLAGVAGGGGSSGGVSGGGRSSGGGRAGGAGGRARQPGRRKFLCFIGDSRGRVQFNAFNHIVANVSVEALKGDNLAASDHAAYFWFSDNSTEPYHGHQRGPIGQWLFDRTLSSQVLSRCTHIIANLGFHPLCSWPRPWWFDELTPFIARCAERLAELAAGGMRVFWQDTIGSPIRARHIWDSPTKTTDPYIIYFNHLCQSIMQQWGIPVIKTYGMQTILSELMDSTRHFFPTGPILHASTQVIAHIYCELS